MIDAGKKASGGAAILRGGDSMKAIRIEGPGGSRMLALETPRSGLCDAVETIKTLKNNGASRIKTLVRRDGADAG